MIRILVALLALAGLLWVTDWLLDRPGLVSVVWMGTEVTLPLAQALAVVVLIVLAVLLLFALLRWLVRGPSRLVAAYRARRRERGYRALSLGLVAVAAGDADEARRLSRRAESLLDEPPLTMLLAAQSAHLEGRDDAARAYFHQLIERPDTAFLGLRGLWMQAMRAGDLETALVHARRADEVRPGTPWVMQALFELHVRLGHWSDAAAVLARIERKGLLPREVARRRRAVIDVELSRTLEAGGEGARAQSAAKEAWKYEPDFIPAAEQLAHLYLAEGRRGRAEKTIEQAWKASPHPAIAREFRHLVGAETPERRVALARELAALAPEDPESRLLVAEVALEAGQWDDAAAELTPLAGEAATVRVCRMMAEIELGRGDAEAARRWLARGALAIPDPAWVCRESGAVQADWTAVSASGAFDSLEWRTPYHLTHQEAIGAGDDKALALLDPPEAEAELATPPPPSGSVS